VQQRHPAPARRAAGRAVHQVEVAQRQLTTAIPASRTRARPRSASLGPCRPSEQQWPHRILPAKRWRNAAPATWRSDLPCTSAVSSTWKVKAALGGERKDAIPPSIDVRQHRCGAAEHAAAVGDQIGQLLGERAAQVVQADQRDGLHGDALGQLLAQLAEQRPGDAMLGRRAVQVRADRNRAVGKRAAQAELEAGAYVLGDQLASRSARTASIAEAKVPSGLPARGQTWPLSRWVSRSINPGQT
jgi:hypothetical protein